LSNQPTKTTSRSGTKSGAKPVAKQPFKQQNKQAAKTVRRPQKLTTSETSAPSIPTMISIGYGNLIAAARVVSIVSPQSSPMRRLREQASASGKLIDATEGRRTRSILVTDSDHVILSAINTETIAARLMPEDTEGSGV
jgi:regulator of extracellular matrix RemA (YlzA/DUF370 family)